jgi:hypothetical protein
MKVRSNNEPGTKLFLCSVHCSAGTGLPDCGLGYGGLVSVCAVDRNCGFGSSGIGAAHLCRPNDLADNCRGGYAGAKKAIWRENTQRRPHTSPRKKTRSS